MKSILRLKVLVSLTSILIMSVFIIGCGVEENEAFEGLGGGNYHPFESPAVANHGLYLTALPDSTVYILNECTECHGEDLDEDGKSCFSCHNEDNHPGLMGNVEAEDEHGDYFQATGWNMNECVFCHWLEPIVYEPENPPIDFGGDCSTSGCHSPENMGTRKCTTCHGQFAGNYADMTTWAPPAALDNSISEGKIGVGAHQSHLNSAGIWAQVECVTCHNIPTGWGDAGHIDSGLPVMADVVLDSLGSNDDGVSSWDHASATCNAYCHFDAEPVWTEVTNTWNQCGGCHALPPTADQSPNHPPVSDCSFQCHTNVDAGLNIIDPALHANGEVD